MNRTWRGVQGGFPGIALCAGVSLAAAGLEIAEVRLVGRPWLESLVLAILIGTAVRTLWPTVTRHRAGIDFCAKTLLEIAVALLGLSLSATAVVEAGPGLIGGIAMLVVVTILASYGIGRGFGLSHRMAVLIACGNSICGNSAIAATAPIIEAEGADVASAIAYTATLGVLVVIGLPFAGAAMGFSPLQYGAFAGLTVYAVPQVIAAAAPLGALSIQFGTLVKLLRVLMLGPVVIVLSLARGRAGTARFHHLVPWFIVGFLALAAIRGAGVVPPALLAGASTTTSALTVVAMAALGLSVDIRAIAGAGARVASAVVLSLLVLAAGSYGLIIVLAIR